MLSSRSLPRRISFLTVPSEAFAATLLCRGESYIFKLRGDRGGGVAGDEAYLDGLGVVGNDFA